MKVKESQAEFQNGEPYLTPPPARAKGFFLFFYLAAALLLLQGCTAFVAARTAASTSASAGTKFYARGELLTDYYAPISQVWTACERVVAEQRAVDVVTDKEFRDGTIDATISRNKVRFSITYKQRGITTVGIRVGLLGNEESSQFLHDRVAEQLRPPE